MTDKVQKIREEVERVHNLLPVMDGDNISVNYADRICTTLEMYIDSLQEEPVSEELEESALLYLSKHYDTSVIWDEDKNCVLRDFKAGAKWQKEQDIKHGYVTFLQGEKRFANYILEMINNGWHITAIKTACNDKIKEE